MGLHRNFTLLTTVDKELKTAAFYHPKKEYIFDFFCDGSLEDVNWYDFIDEIASISALCPNRKIIVEVEEGDGEKWRLYALNGETTVVNSQLVWDRPPFELEFGE